MKMTEWNYQRIQIIRSELWVGIRLNVSKSYAINNVKLTEERIKNGWKTPTEWADTALKEFDERFPVEVDSEDKGISQTEKQ